MRKLTPIRTKKVKKLKPKKKPVQLSSLISGGGYTLVKPQVTLKKK